MQRPKFKVQRAKFKVGIKKAAGAAFFMFCTDIFSLKFAL
jgi:hypothetical protein